MKKLSVLFVLLTAVFFSYDIIAQENFNKSKPTLESGKITIKVKEGVGPFQMQTGSVSFGISSLDQKVADFGVNKLTERFIHKPIQENSGLPDLSRIYQIEFPTQYNVLEVARDFSRDPNVEYAEPIPINYPAHEPNDPLYNQLWFLPKIQAPSAWDIHKGEDGDSIIVLSITDSGCKFDHPDIAENIWNNTGEDSDDDGHTFEWNGSVWILDPGDINGIDDDLNGFTDDLIGWNFYNNSNNPNDVFGHGTPVSGVAGGTTNNNQGIASISYNLELMPVAGFYFNSIIYAAENGADVINCSWGGFSFSLADMEAVEYSSGLGSIIVAAAHNYDNSVPVYPASYPKVISVSGLDPQDIKLQYSSFGSAVDVSAPGPVLSSPFIGLLLNNSYGDIGLGTSFSAPLVTGLVGLIKSYHPTWTINQIIKQLLYTTDNIDLINPGFEHLLGTGRINAYRSLADSQLTVTPELKLNLSILPNDLTSSLKILSQNSIIDFGIRVQNYSHFLNANPLNITLTSDNPDIQIIDGNFSGLVSADTVIDLLKEFQIQIAPNAATNISKLSLNATSNLPIVAGSLLEFYVIVNPSGVLVWEGEENGQDYSGTFIKNYLTSNNYPVLYTNRSIFSYLGLDALFLSFGNFGEFVPGSNTFFSLSHALAIQDYLENSGKVYLEGGDALGFDQAGNTDLLNLFGVASTDDGGFNTINLLQGQSGTLTEGMLFSSSTQINNYWIDKYLPNSNGQAAFIESGYGTVGVQSSGSFGQKTFCFSYSLANLIDGTTPSTKNELLQKILDFFEVVVPVELTSFTGNSVDGNIILNWSTASEINNRIFEIERRKENSDFVMIGFVEGKGTTTEKQEYSFIDKNITSGKYFYRLKQIDFDGTFEYSNEIEINTAVLLSFSLEQNFPNPFNPSTKITYSIPDKSFVTIKVYDPLGREIFQLVNEEKPSGNYEVDFNAGNLPSGVYLYKIQADSFVETKKMLLLK